MSSRSKFGQPHIQRRAARDHARKKAGREYRRWLKKTKSPAELRLMKLAGRVKQRKG